MNDTCNNCRTAPDTAGWLIFNDSASSAAVIVPSGLTSIAPITRADIVGTPLLASTPANRSTNRLISSGVGSSAMTEAYRLIYRKILITGAWRCPPWHFQGGQPVVS